MEGTAEQKLRLGTYLVGDNRTAAVGDNSCGMSDDVKDHIIEPYYLLKSK